MKKIYISILIISLFSFLFYFLLQNIHLKIWHYEYVTYLFDKNKESHLDKIKTFDYEKILNKKINFYFWNYFKSTDTIKNLGWKIILKTNLTKLYNLNNFELLQYKINNNNFYIKDLEYTVVFEKQLIMNYFLKKIKENNIKILNIDNLYFTSKKWLVWILSKTPNLYDKKKKFYFDLFPNDKFILTSNVKNINFEVINKLDVFTEKYESKLFNYNNNVYIIVKNNVLSKIIWKKIKLFSISPNEIENYLEINNNKEKYFSMNKNLEIKTNNVLKEIFQLNLFPKSISITNVKNNIFTIYEKQLFTTSWFSKIKNEKIFKPINIFLNTKIKVYNKSFTNIKTFEIKSNKLLCNIIDWINNKTNLTKKINYEILNNNLIHNFSDFSNYIISNKNNLNNELNYLSKILFYLNIPIVNKNSSTNTILGYNSDYFYSINSPLRAFNIDFFDNRNDLSLNTSNEPFFINCEYEKENNKMKISLWYENIKSKNIFWPVKIDNIEKWTIISNGIETIYKTKK